MDRNRKHFLAYAKHLAHSDPNGQVCAFCNPEGNVRIKETHAYFYVSYNTFPYDWWELRAVTEHLLLIPKRHVGTLGTLTDEESTELAKLLGHYEKSGYDIFARTPTSLTRTVVHQHTHLIRTSGKKARGIFFWPKPYILWLFR